MKFLKGLLVALLVIAALILVVPLFLPSESTWAAKTEIEISPEQVFHNVALYTDRMIWDPWIAMDTDAAVTIIPQKGYIGSTYAWDGEKIGTGKMEVQEVHFPDFIKSHIWFGDMQDPSVVEWELEKTESGTRVTWKFISKGKYPFGRLMMVFMKGSMMKSFESGLAHLKSFLETNPPVLYELSEIKIDKSYDTQALVVPVSGTIDQIIEKMQQAFPMIFQEIQEQGLTPNGPAFVHYSDYDEATGFSNAEIAVPVNKKGVKSGEVVPKFYPAVEAVVATQRGDYTYFRESYDALAGYIEENNLEVTGEAFEVYLKTMMDSSNPMDWITMIAFPLKK